MRFGVVLPLFIEGKTAPASAIVELAQAAEALGYDSIWMQDDPTGAGLDALALLGVIAGATRRARIGFSIMVLPQREAVATARALATIDQVSGGRLVAGVGVGSARAQSPVYDVATADRGRLMDEQIDVMQALWRGEEVNREGRWVRVAGAQSPRPVQDGIPIYVGTWGNEGGLRRVVRAGQGWMASGIRTRQDRYAAASKRLDELCAAAGRDPATIERGFVNCPLALADTYEAGVEMAAPLLVTGYHLSPDQVGVPFIGTDDDARKTLDSVRALNAGLVAVFPQRLDPRMLERFRDGVAGGFA